MTNQIYRRRNVEQLVGLSRSTIYAMMAEGRFPKPVKLGRRAVGWRETGWHDSTALMRALMQLKSPTFRPSFHGRCKMGFAATITRGLNGHWHGTYGSACCPAHDDKTPSLSIADGFEGRLGPQRVVLFY